jgi:hypothetical protein
MRWIAVDRRLLVEFLVAALSSAIPLLLLRYPIGELVEKFVERLTGL